MTIEVGTVFSDTFTKEGRRIEVTKTYTWDGVVINQRIYDAGSGELINEKTTINPIKENVKLVSPNQTNTTVQKSQQTDPQPENTKQVVDKNMETEPIEKEEVVDELVQDVDEDVEYEDLLDLELITQRIQDRYQLIAIQQVMVGSNNGRSEILLEATRQKRLFGLFQVESNTTITVDAQTGNLINEQKPLRTKLIDLFSF